MSSFFWDRLSGFVAAAEHYATEKLGFDSPPTSHPPPYSRDATMTSRFRLTADLPVDDEPLQTTPLSHYYLERSSSSRSANISPPDEAFTGESLFPATPHYPSTSNEGDLFVKGGKQPSSLHAATTPHHSSPHVFPNSPLHSSPPPSSSIHPAHLSPPKSSSTSPIYPHSREEDSPHPPPPTTTDRALPSVKLFSGIAKFLKTNQFFQDVISAYSPDVWAEFDPHIHHIAGPLFIMDFPHESFISSLGEKLNTSFDGKYAIFNMSERTYEKNKYFMGGKIFDIHYKGLPAPPVSLQLLLCMQAYTWLQADNENILLVHCYKGYSRSVLFMAIFMVWSGMRNNLVATLREVSNCVNISEKFLGHITPSQRRYVGYFSDIEKGLLPTYNKLRITKMILRGIPRFENWLLDEEESLTGASTAGKGIFRPYIEIWSDEKKIYSSESDVCATHADPLLHTHSTSEMLSIDELVKGNFPANSREISDSSSSSSLKWYTDKDSEVVFDFDLEISGDVLFRVLHLSLENERISALRFAVNCGYIAGSRLNLSKTEIDGAAIDESFPENFSIDLIISEKFEDDSQEVESEKKLIQRAKKMSMNAHEHVSYAYEKNPTMDTILEKSVKLDETATRLANQLYASTSKISSTLNDMKDGVLKQLLQSDLDEEDEIERTSMQNRRRILNPKNREETRRRREGFTDSPTPLPPPGVSSISENVRRDYMVFLSNSSSEDEKTLKKASERQKKTESAYVSASLFPSSSKISSFSGDIFTEKSTNPRYLESRGDYQQTSSSSISRIATEEYGEDVVEKRGIYGVYDTHKSRFRGEAEEEDEEPPPALIEKKITTDSQDMELSSTGFVLKSYGISDDINKESGTPETLPQTHQEEEVIPHTPQQAPPHTHPDIETPDSLPTYPHLTNSPLGGHLLFEQEEVSAKIRELRGKVLQEDAQVEGERAGGFLAHSKLNEEYEEAFSRMSSLHHLSKKNIFNQESEEDSEAEEAKKTTQKLKKLDEEGGVHTLPPDLIEKTSNEAFSCNFDEKEGIRGGETLRLTEIIEEGKMYEGDSGVGNEEESAHTRHSLSLGAASVMLQKEKEDEMNSTDVEVNAAGVLNVASGAESAAEELQLLLDERDSFDEYSKDSAMKIANENLEKNDVYNQEYDVSSAIDKLNTLPEDFDMMSDPAPPLLRLQEKITE